MFINVFARQSSLYIFVAQHQPAHSNFISEHFVLSCFLLPVVCTTPVIVHVLYDFDRCFVRVINLTSELLGTFCRLNATESLINSYLFRPKCVARDKMRLPSICQCEKNRDNGPKDRGSAVCQTETSSPDTSRPTVTFWTRLTASCINQRSGRYVLVTNTF